MIPSRIGDAGRDWRGANEAAERALYEQKDVASALAWAEQALSDWEKSWPGEPRLGLGSGGKRRQRARSDARMALVRFHDPSLHRALCESYSNNFCELLDLTEPLRCQRCAMSLGAGIAANLLAFWAEYFQRARLLGRFAIIQLAISFLPEERKRAFGAVLGLDPAENVFCWQELPPFEEEMLLNQDKFAQKLFTLYGNHPRSQLLQPFQSRKYRADSSIESEFIVEKGALDKKLPALEKNTSVSSEGQTGEENDVSDDEADAAGEKTRDPELMLGSELGRRIAESPGYQVFSRADDRIIRPEQILDKAQMKALWQAFHAQLPRNDRIARQAAKLRRQLLGLDLPRLEFEQEEGWPNSNALARLITSPNQTRVFQQERPAEWRRVAFTLLLDCSGSMKGEPMRMAAQCADALIQVLERAGIGVELLGFTTCSNQEGPAYQRWLEAGSPANPGRLNESLHLVFKSEHESWRNARYRLGALFQNSWLKENLDGEALAWAAGRLLQRPEPRKILLVISDGAPLDPLTVKVNGKRYLEDHLHQVMDHLNETAVELAAIGLKYNIHRYYKNAKRVSLLDDLSEVLFGWVEGLIKVKKRKTTQMDF